MRPRVLIVWVAGLATAGAAFAQEDDLLTRLIDQAKAVGRAGDYMQSANFYREAVRKAEASRDPRLPQILSGLADTNDELGRSREAERQYQRALSLVEATDGIESPAYAAIAVNLGTHFAQTGQTAKGEGLVREALAILAAALPPNDYHLTMARNCLALMAMDNRRYNEAESLLNQILEAYRQHPQPRTVYAGVTLTNLGVLRNFQGRYEEAARLFAESVTSIEIGLGQDHPLLVRALNNLAMADLSLGRRDAAETDFQRALAVAEKRLGTANPLYGKVLLNYAEAERRFGNKKAAKAMEARAKAILGDNARINGAGMTVDASAFQPHR